MNLSLKNLIVLSIALLALLLCPLFGAEIIPFNSLFSTSSMDYRIFWELRIPRWLLCIGVGGILSSLGGCYQNILRNPLAEPYVLGISSAVALVLVSLDLFTSIPPTSMIAVILAGIVGTLASIFLLAMSSSPIGIQVDRILLSGLGLNFVLSATLFLLLSYVNQQMGGGSLRWLFGNIPWPNLITSASVFSISVLLLVTLVLFSRQMDALTLGDSVARTLGFSPNLCRMTVLVLSSTMLAVTVALTGSIGFVGLVVPHVVRLIFRPDSTRSLLALSYLLGGVFLTLSDVLSRSILPPFEFPIGIITTLIGGPIFLAVLWRR